MNDLEVSKLNEIDAWIDDAINKDDVNLILDKINRMIQAKELVGKALAKIIYLLYHSWNKFSVSEQESCDDMLKLIKVHPYTTSRYLSMWENMSTLSQAFQERPVREIIPVTNALSQNYKISEEVMEKLERATTVAEIQRIVTKDVKGKEPRKFSLQPCLDVNTGEIYGWYNGERCSGGYLDVASKHPGVQKLIKRIVDNTGMIRR